MWFTNVNGQDIEATEQREIATNIDRALESGLHAYVKEGYTLEITTVNDRSLLLSIVITAIGFFINKKALSIAYGLASFIIGRITLPTTVSLTHGYWTTTYYFWPNSSKNYYFITSSILVDLFGVPSNVLPPP